MSCKSPYFDFPKNFENFWLTGQLPRKTKLLNKVQLALRQLLTLCSVITKSIYLKILLHNELQELSKLQDQEINLVRTFLYQPNPKVQDPFWGDLVNILAINKRPVLTIYDPHFPLALCKKAYSPERRNLPYLAFLSPSKLFKNYFLLIIEAFKKIKFKGCYSVRGTDIQNFVTNSYQNELLTPASLINLVFMDVFENILKKHPIHKAYLTFESNPWEKMFYLARKATNKKIMVIGFQHSSMQAAATNYLLSAYEAQHQLCPDKIMSVGEYTYQLMKSYPHYKNIEVEKGCALRYSYLEKINHSVETKKIGKINLLVILDGILSTAKLIQLVLDFEKDNYSKNISIIIREHPSLSIKKIMPEFLTNKSFLNNCLNLSTEDLQTNLEWSDIVLYTGSTISIEALKMGKAVISYNYTLFNFDPLFQFTEFKWKVSTPQDLKDAIIKYSKLSPEELKHSKLVAKNYVNRYFSPCTKDNIERFL